MEIVVRQISGLGNQLFQYAAGRYYATRHSASLRIAVDPPERAFSYGAPRPFLLSHFAIRAPHGYATPTERILLNAGRRHRALTVIPRRALGLQVIEEQVSQRHTFLQCLPLRPHTRRAYLVGYWQTYKAAAAEEQRLREEFTLRTPLSELSTSMLEKIHQTATPVSLHIRRGDYMLAAEGNRVLPMGYYAAAIDRLRGWVLNPTFFVFSDDPEFARRELGSVENAIFVHHNSSAEAHEDLWLMSRCHHHIIANSSFSWWGAWLNPRSAKHVIAPRQWMMTTDSYFPELMPPAWELLDVAK